MTDATAGPDQVTGATPDNALRNADRAKDGLIERDSDCIRVRASGRLLIRNICMVFDRYLRDNSERSFSKVI